MRILPILALAALAFAGCSDNIHKSTIIEDPFVPAPPPTIEELMPTISFDLDAQGWWFAGNVWIGDPCLVFGQSYFDNFIAPNLPPAVEPNPEDSERDSTNSVLMNVGGVLDFPLVNVCQDELTVTYHDNEVGSVTLSKGVVAIIPMTFFQLFQIVPPVENMVVHFAAGDLNINRRRLKHGSLRIRLEACESDVPEPTLGPVEPFPTPSNMPR